MPKSQLELNKEEVINYYIIEGHTREQSSKHFKCSAYEFEKFCKENAIIKSIKALKTKLNASVEEVIEYYIKENHSQEETIKHFNCGTDALYNFLKRNNIIKPRNLINKLESNQKNAKKEKSLNQVPIEELTFLCNSPLYSRKDILEALKINAYTLDLLLSKYSLSISRSFGKEVREVLRKFSKEDIFDYYITQNHSQKETRYYLGGITQDSFLTILKYYEIEKNFNLDYLKSKVSKEYLYHYYIEEKHSREETLEHFNLNDDSFYNLLASYNILKVERIDSLTSRISKEDLEDYYIKNKHTYQETLEHFKINSKSIWTFYNLISYYNLPLIYDVNKNSGPNIEFKELLDDNNIEYIQEFYIGRKHYDFKVGNILIEINPTYTHNSTYGYRNLDDPLPPTYHLEKSLLASVNGYRCIHIWDWDDKDKLIFLLKPRETLYARKCFIKESSLKEAKIYLNKYHLQNYARDSIRLGLYFNNELVSIMTFSRPRYNKKYNYELIRYCAHKNVVGGAEKLFKYFVDNYNPTSIISYCDNSKFTGDVYSRLGFSLLNKGTPTKHWYNEKANIHITDNLLRQRGFDQLFKANYGKGTSNESLMLDHDFLEVYDCGQSSYVWNVDKPEVL